MEIDLLRYFVVTAEMEHITKAANVLHITQPSLSSAIKRLENHLGIPLFEKDGRGIKLTEPARNYYKKIKAALDLIDAADAEVAAELQKMDRTLTIFAPNLLNFPGVFDLIMRDYPDLQFSHVGMSYSQLIESLKDQKLDFAICWAAYFDPALSYKTLTEQEFVVSVGPQNAYYDREEITLEELNRLPLIASRVGEAKMDFLTYVMQKHGISPISISHAISKKDAMSVIEGSTFASLQPIDTSHPDSGDSKIHNLRIKDVSPIRENLYLIYNKDKQRAVSRDVCRLIAENFSRR